jgi:hypothetical protein
MVQIIQVLPSHVKGKKYTATFDTGTRINFGSDVSKTYVEGASKEKRDAYMKRHLANNTEYYRIHNLIPSPALLSYYLLWNTNNLQQNIKILNNKLKTI